MAGLERLNPSRHMPKTDYDRNRIIRALCEGWELMVDSEGTVWIGDHEEPIAVVTVQAV